MVNSADDDQFGDLDDLLENLDNDQADSDTGLSAPLPPPSPNVMMHDNGIAHGKVQQIGGAIPANERFDNRVADDQAQRIVAHALSEFDSVGKEILDNVRADRAQQQVVIDHLLPVITGAERPQMVPGAYLEALSSILATKADGNLTAVKILDSRAKLLAALKSQIVVQNNNINNGESSVELEQLLAAPAISDFDGDNEK